MDNGTLAAPVDLARSRFGLGTIAIINDN